ncbi:conserved hypothetical protein [Alteracholeplasma palmae J233]|uniref:Uncharacterized protein n=1 Tax=Alteracholeplasma palmae (strain ATCC 49389 / J233) TaxID=1318466 RepID=U4KSA2_ALTPJ|nr:hypothetical protein [Alteracholeplasma palmae]CCV64866.1 conserved hypothetical protein [Alteracholeplasma palmae J233]
MKKFLIFVISIFSIFTLIACQDSININLEIVDTKIGFKKITYKLNWEDEKNQLLSNSMYAIAFNDDKEVSRYEKIEKNKEFSLTNLKADTDYQIVIFGTHKTKVVELYKKNEKTLLKGSDEENPYLINTKEELLEIQKVMESDDTKTQEVLLETYYKLNADIDFNSEELKNSIFNDKDFTGVFDGNGHEIKNIILKNDSKSHTSLFGRVSGKITNIKLSNIKIDNMEKSNTGTNYIAIISSYSYNSAVFSKITIENSEINQKHKSQYSSLYLGSISGYARGSYSDITLSNVTINVDIDKLPSAYIGSVIGSYEDSNMNKHSRMTRVYVKNTLIDVDFSYEESETSQRNLNIGGIAGKVIGPNQGTETNLYFSGNIKADQKEFTKLKDEKTPSSSEINIGGIFGHDRSYLLADVFVDAKIEVGKEQNIKGIKEIKVGLVTGNNSVVTNAIGKGTVEILTDEIKNIKTDLLANKFYSQNYLYQEALFKVDNIVVDTEYTLIFSKTDLENKKINNWILEKIV